jgi:hypothetical protein
VSEQPGQDESGPEADVPRIGPSGRSPSTTRGLGWSQVLVAVVLVAVVIPLAFLGWWAFRTVWVPHSTGNYLEGLAEDIGGLTEGGRNSTGDVLCFLEACYQLTIYYDSSQPVTELCSTVEEVLGPRGTPTAAGDVCLWSMPVDQGYLTVSVTRSQEVKMSLLVAD